MAALVTVTNTAIGPASGARLGLMQDLPGLEPDVQLGRNRSRYRMNHLPGSG